MYLETFAETGAKPRTALAIAAFAGEESWCQLKPVIGPTSISVMGSSKLSVAESIVFHRQLARSRTGGYGQGFLEIC